VVPPLVGVAVKVTLVPAQMGIVGDETTVTEGATAPVTTIVTVFDVAGLPVTQVKLEVIIQVTMSPLAKVLEV